MISAVTGGLMIGPQTLECRVTERRASSSGGAEGCADDWGEERLADLVTPLLRGDAGLFAHRGHPLPEHPFDEVDVLTQVEQVGTRADAATSRRG
jgi:hypothetical protein